MGEWIGHVLESGQLSLAALPAAFLLGVFAAASSCCNIAAVGAIAGYSGSRENEGRRTTLLAGLFFMLGSIIALAALGAVAGFISQVMGSALGRYWKIFAGLAAIFFGLATLNLVPFKLPSIRREESSPPKGLFGAAVFGLAIGGSATACTACCNPVLAAALGVAVLQGHTLWGAVILTAFAIGFSLPLTALLVGLSFGKATVRTRNTATVVRIVAGVLLIGVGFYFLVTI